MVLSENPYINKLLKEQGKHVSLAYKQAKLRSKLSPLDELQRRVLKRLAPRLSVDRFKQLSKYVNELSPLERQDWLQAKQDELNGLR